jgi:hypothetical protein
MAIIQSNKSDYERKQGILLPKRGVYGAILARYTLPKEYTNTWGTKEKIGFGFVITHDQAYRELPQYAGAFRLAPNTLFYNKKKLTSSNLIEYLYAFTAGKKPKDVLVDEIFDYDDFMGRPVLLLAEPSAADSEGIRYNNVINIDPIDKEMYAAMKPVLSTVTLGKNEKNGTTFVQSPTEATLEPNAAPAPPPVGDDETWPDEVPF